MAAPTAGYSQTPLLAKLGLSSGKEVAILDAPAGLIDTWEIPGDVALRTKLPPQGRSPRHDVDLIVLFVLLRATLEEKLPRLAACLAPAGGLWVAWPKLAARKSLGLASDMTEDVVRAVVLPLGLVDNKVCAIDATWSGLRCVWRRERRPELEALVGTGARPKAPRSSPPKPALPPSRPGPSSSGRTRRKP